MTHAWGSPQLVGEDPGDAILSPQEALDVLQLLAMQTFWHLVFLTEACKEATLEHKMLSSKTSHGNDTLLRKRTVLPGRWAATSHQGCSALLISSSTCWLPTPPTTQPHGGKAWSNLPSPIKGLSNELICRNLPSNFYTKLLQLFPTQVLRQK